MAGRRRGKGRRKVGRKKRRMRLASATASKLLDSGSTLDAAPAPRDATGKRPFNLACVQTTQTLSVCLEPGGSGDI